MSNLDFSQIEEVVPSRCIIKLTTSYWSDSRGVHVRRDLNYLRRKCSGWNILEEDVSAIGADDVVPLIVNLDSCEDGIYEVFACNESYDWESGYSDYYEYKLIPYTDESDES